MLMEFVEAEALKLTQTAQHIFPNTLFQRIVTALLVCKHAVHTARTEHSTARTYVCLCVYVVRNSPRLPLSPLSMLGLIRRQGWDR